jgi:peptidoglycan/xylan/chitin deacetylase (PgdA/CDA1 family)
VSRVTLTFDNGPEPKWTHHVLDVLGKHEIKATFFIIGCKVATIPDGRRAVERAKAEGHWIGNHSYNHLYSLGDIDRIDAFDIEVVRTFNVLEGLAHPDLLFRPFCNAGILNDRVFKKVDVARLCESEYSCVLFNSVPRDWEHPDAWLGRALGDIEKRPWTTLVLHDIAGYPNGVNVGAMLKLDEFIKRAKDKGREFVQDYSPDCLMVSRGKELQDLSSLTH